GQGQVGVGHHPVGVHLEAGADARAGGACPIGDVEAEVAGLQLLEGEVAFRAGEGLGEGEGGAVDDVDVDHSPGEGQGRLQRLGEALFDPRLLHQAVDDHLDAVLVVAVQADVVGEVPHLPVDAGPG